MQNGYPYSVGAYIFNTKTNKILVTISNSNRIGIPKGYLNENETTRDGAMREIREETGLIVSIHEHTPHIKYFCNDQNRVYYILLIEDENIVLSPEDTTEIKKACWFSYLDLLNNFKECNATIKIFKNKVADKINELIYYGLHRDLLYKAYNEIKISHNYFISHKQIDFMIQDYVSIERD